MQVKVNSVNSTFNYKLYYWDDLAKMWQYCKNKYKVSTRKELREKLTLSTEEYHKLHKKEYKTSLNNGTSNPVIPLMVNIDIQMGWIVY